MARFQRWDPDRFLSLMHQTVPDYERLQDETVIATGTDARRVLELGTGTGETTRRVLARHPAAVLVGLDASSEMLERAQAALPADRVHLRVARLEAPLPNGPFDVVLSVLAVHHLDGTGKAELFRRAADRLTPSGRLVLGDFVVPEDPSDFVTELDPDYDTPSTIVDQLRWLTETGLQARVTWAHRDLAVLVGRALARS
jgi:tRNA (cmo5U34)-methyltransferase